MRLRLLIDGQEHDVDAVWVDDGVRVTVGDRAVTVALHRLDEHAFLLRSDGRRLSCVAAGRGRQRELWVNGRTVRYEVGDTRRHSAPPDGEAELVASLPGVVRDVLVQVGDHVRAGDKLVVLESMKMEMVVQAPYAGVVEALFVVEGQTVDGGEHLLAVKAEES